MTIIDALTKEEPGVRVVYGDRWLVGTRDDEGGYFTVYERQYGQKKTRKIVETAVEDEAVRYLLGLR